MQIAVSVIVAVVEVIVVSVLVVVVVLVIVVGTCNSRDVIIAAARAGARGIAAHLLL